MSSRAGGVDPLTRFEVEREVGRGAAGIVFKALDRERGEPVALKMIALPNADPAERERMLDEGALLLGIDHPGIVRVVDFGQLDEAAGFEGHRFEPGTPYLAMEWLAGEDLAQRQSSRPLSLPEALRVAAQTASALAAAHEGGISHRDVKPSNIFVMGEGEGLRCTLVDFGVAASDAQDLTGAAGFVGTPAYMAPEQARGATTLDPRCDVYSLGATVFELIAGRPPHTGPSPIAILAKLVSTPAQRLSEVVLDVPEALDELVAEMLSLELTDRPSARVAAARFEALQRDPSLPQTAFAVDRQLDSALSSVSRLVTTMVALQVGTGEQRAAELKRLREAGTEAVALGRDSIVAHLGVRRAHGGEAPRAIELGQQLAAAGARVGVATGRAMIALARPAGEVVDKASALAREARPGQLLADESSTELARSSFELAPVSQGAWELRGAMPERRRLKDLTPFVGRDAELTTLCDAYVQCVERSRPRVVSVTGPPGIGKSRLARELLRHLATRPMPQAPVTERSAQARKAPSAPGAGGAAPASPAAGVARGGRSRPSPGVRIVQTRSEAYGRSRALGIAADTLCNLLGLPKGASLPQVSRLVGKLELEHDESGLMASLLANEPLPAQLDPQRARDILYLAMTELMLKVTRDQPCVLMLEDVQWSDPESVAWFDHLLSRAADRPLLLVCLARPGFWKDHPRSFAERDHTRIDLRPIPRRAAMEIARAVIGCDAGDPKLREVANQAAGSPLFAEELARVIAAGKPVAAVPSIEAAIQVSLDALEEQARDALVRVSVFGVVTWDAGLAAVGVEDAGKMLEQLSAADLLVEQEQSRFPGHREFWFKHALVRDVAYASASEVTRQEMHAQVAAWLAGVGGDAATIAEHYDLGERHHEAAGYWERAARRALAANALRDAVKMADRALTFADEQHSAFARATLLDEAYSRLDERSADRAEAIEAMADNAYDEASEVRTLGARARYDNARSAGHDVEERLVEAVQRSRSLGMWDEAARCAATLATRYAFAGQLGMAEAEAQKLLILSFQRQMKSAEVDAWQALAIVQQTRGELGQALIDRRNAAKAAREAGIKQREAMLTINLGFALTTIGAKDEARREIEAGLRMAEEIGSAGTVRLGRMILLGWAAHFGADPSLDPALAEPRSAADEAATGGWIVKDRVTLGVLFYRGWELLFGDPAALKRAHALLKLSAEDYRATGNRDVLPVALGYWAEAERRLGNLEEAEKLALEAAELVEAGAPSLLNEAIIYLALHAARVDMGDLSGAREAIERAIPLLLRRVRGLRGTAYERQFLTLAHNARLLEAADTHGLVPENLESFLEQ